MKRILFSLFFLVFSIGLYSQPDVYTPSLNSPANNSINQMPDVPIHWNAITGSNNLRYQVQLDTSSSFSSSLLRDTTLVLLSGYKTYNLLFNTKYYWRVRAIDNGQTSFWSVVWNFTTFNSVELEKPQNNDGGILAPDTTIQWKTTIGNPKVDISGITGYRYQLDTSLLFNSPLLIEGTTNSIPVAGFEYKTAKPLNMNFGSTYYWRVRAEHGAGYSEYCTPWSFKVLGRITLASPANNATDQFKDLSLKWTKVSGLLAYLYEIAEDPDFTQMVDESETTVPEVATDFLKFGVTYYWRVKARHALDTSDWSNAWKFTMINTVVLKTPANNETDVSLTPTLTWTAQTGIIKYGLQFADNPTFDNPIINIQPGPNDTKYPIPYTKKLLPEKNYYWRMRAYANGVLLADTTDWSTAWTFKTGSAIGIEDNAPGKFTIYPNPASTKIFVKLDAGTEHSINFTLLDLVGKMVFNQQIDVTPGMNVKEISLSNISKGIYIGRITVGENIVNQKIIIEK